MEKYIKMLEDWFSKLTPLPTNVKDVLVKIAPWVSLIFGALGVLGIIGAIGLLAVFLSTMMLGAVLALVSSVLMLVAFPGLRDRKEVGWKWSFYSQLASIASSLVVLNFIGALVGALIGFYLLFQIKSYYK